MDFLLKPFQYEFFTRAILVGVMSGLLCGVMGVYITTRRMSYIAHGLSHAILGGAVLTYVLGLNFYVGSGIWGFGAALLIQYLTGRRVYSDAAIGIVTTACFALGVAVISTYRKFSQNFEAALFGNVLGVSPTDLWVVTGVTDHFARTRVFLLPPAAVLVLRPRGGSGAGRSSRGNGHAVCLDAGHFIGRDVTGAGSNSDYFSRCHSCFDR